MIGIVLQTGVDMVDVERLARMVTLSGDAFLESSWTLAERLYCANRPERLASRWAAKEATMKALGQGVGQISLLEVEVEASEGQMPTLLLSGNAAARARQLHLDTWSLSLTHEDRWALAFVVGLGNTGHG
ncbi:holo-ACP synthase [Streptomyces hokutonensis]|jgi:holo-[acyl-carrier protein] synthase|uniref:holo-ACP synthase n=1 Tax=Streptomyces hokutonensis TaxID=1306990 RepID=UPI00380B6103